MATDARLNQPVMELDLRGSVCPGPTADTLLALKKLPPGARLGVTTDYPPARQTIPRLLQERGWSWRMTEDDGETFRLEITKGDG
jgi:TusA-related sulfurtransferase